jgi:hypothetical protein
LTVAFVGWLFCSHMWWRGLGYCLIASVLNKRATKAWRAANSATTITTSTTEISCVILTKLLIKKSFVAYLVLAFVSSILGGT